METFLKKSLKKLKNRKSGLHKRCCQSTDQMNMELDPTDILMWKTTWGTERKGCA